MSLIRCNLLGVPRPVRFGLFYRMSAGKAKHDAYSTEMLEKLAARIQHLRKQKGFANYERFANEHDVARGQYWRYEKGENLRFTSLLRVVKALDVTLAEFFSEGFD